MKHIIIKTILLLTISLNTFSQINVKRYNLIDTLQKQIYDTIDVILLVCDTTDNYYSQYYIDSYTINREKYIYSSIDDTIYLENRNFKVRWCFGKEVQISTYFYAYYNDRWYLDWTHKKYLNKFGDPLPEGLVVWQSIKRKNN